jgi:nitroreductase
MDLFEAIEKRTSVRDLRAVNIPDADLELILNAGRRAPSGRNRQPIDFIVVRNIETLKKLSKAQSPIADVALAIAVVADPEKSEFWLEDVAAATENMLLAVTALGYASVWIEGTLLREEEAHKKTLGVPEKMRLMVVLPIGAAKTSVQATEKRPLSDMVHWERYDDRSR